MVKLAPVLVTHCVYELDLLHNGHCISNRLCKHDVPQIRYQPFVYMLIDAVCLLSRFKPQELKDAQPETFTCKVKVLMGVMDYPGWGHLTRHRGSPAVVGACYKSPIRGQRLPRQEDHISR